MECGQTVRKRNKGRNRLQSKPTTCQVLVCVRKTERQGMAMCVSEPVCVFDLCSLALVQYLKAFESWQTKIADKHQLAATSTSFSRCYNSMSLAFCTLKTFYTFF